MNILYSTCPLCFLRPLSRTLFLSIALLIISSGIVQADSCRVVRVYDGDSITVIMGGKKQRIRLCGIDTPKKSRKKGRSGQPYSQKATKYLAGLILGENVSIEEYRKDRYGRILRVIYLYQTNVNIDLVRNGYTEVYRGRPAKGFDSDPYRSAEKLAREDQLNVWSLGDEYVSPKDWRRGVR